MPLAVAGAVLVTAPLLSQAAGGNAKAEPVRYTALAVRTVGYTATVPVEFTIQRWTTDAEHEKLNTALLEKGQRALLDTMREMPEIGRLSSPGNVGIPLRYARRQPRADGAEQVTVITERELSFWEASQRPRSADYPFSVMEMNIGPNGEGTGRMLVATRITFNKISKVLTIENFEDSPVQLNGVKKVK
jgi:hypothetical protein